MPLSFASGAEGIRTPDLLSAIQALYQLSYSPDRADEHRKTVGNSLTEGLSVPVRLVERHAFEPLVTE
jgi:hypothetical protein